MTTLDYNTAKKLKEAGFPQTGDLMITPDGSLIQHDQTRPDKFDCYCPKCSQWEEEYCIIPTLSELIEACVPHFMNLHYAYLSGKFGAYGYADLEEGRENEVFSDWCKTPEIAVANLYLALHE